MPANLSIATLIVGSRRIYLYLASACHQSRRQKGELTDGALLDVRQRHGSVT